MTMLSLVARQPADTKRARRRGDLYADVVVELVRRGNFDGAARVLAERASTEEAALVALVSAKRLTGWTKGRLGGALRRRIARSQ